MFIAPGAMPFGYVDQAWTAPSRNGIAPERTPDAPQPAPTRA